MDDGPVDIGERWLLLAEKMWNGPHGYTKSVYEKIINCYTQAKKFGADNTKVDKAMNVFLDSIVTRENTSENDVMFVLDHRPEDADLYWKIVEFKTKNFTFVTDIDYTTKGYVASLVEKESHKNLVFKNAQNACDALEKNIESLDKEILTHQTEILPFVEKAISYGGDKALLYQTQWKNYLAFVSDKSNEIKSTIRKKILNFKDKSQKSNSYTKRLFVSTGIIKSIFSIVCLIGCIVSYKIGYNYINNSPLFANKDSFLFFIVTIGGSLLIGCFILMLLTGFTLIFEAITAHRDPLSGKDTNVVDSTSVIFGVFKVNNAIQARCKSPKCMFKEPLICRIINITVPYLLILTIVITVIAFAVMCGLIS